MNKRSFYTIMNLHLNKKIMAILFCFAIIILKAWGPTGHRVVGEVATQHIKKNTKRKIEKLLNHESLAAVSTFGDDIKSDARYNAFYNWHFVNLSDNQKYNGEEHIEGDVLHGIQICVDTIKSKKTSTADKAFYLKLLVHFIGDLHQPLHVGHKEDKGGNDIKVTWFKANSNLHRVWDENMIESYGMSYTELTQNLPYADKEAIKNMQKGSVLDWGYESQQLAQKVYQSAKNDEALGYAYQYQNFSIVKSQLQKGGLRLAKILDEVFK